MHITVFLFHHSKLFSFGVQPEEGQLLVSAALDSLSPAAVAGTGQDHLPRSISAGRVPGGAARAPASSES